MQENTSVATMIGIVLIACVAVIGFSYGAFAITRGIAHQGSDDVIVQSEKASDSWASTFDGREVTGGQLLSILYESDTRIISIFISTRAIEQDISNVNNMPVLRFNDKYYINYGIVYNYEDSGYGYVDEDTDFSSNSNLFVVRDNVSLSTDYLPKFEDSILVKNNNFSPVYNAEAKTYVNPSSKYYSNLIYDINDEVCGVIFSQCTKTTYSGNTNDTPIGNIPF